MNSELIECPACKHALRVPENLFGKTVRCPECKAHFTAPKREADGKLGAPVLLPKADATAQRRGPIRFTESPFFMPATLLVLVSTIGCLINGYQVVTWHVDRERAERAITWLIEQYANFSRQELSNEDVQNAHDAGMISHHVVFGMSLISLAGGIAMLFRRFRWLGILGSVLAMINISNCCCVLGLPAGGYCLIKLIDPDLAPLFQRPR
jgi:hypothetical protein